MRIRYLYQRGIFARAFFHAFVATVAEITVIWHIYGVGNKPGYAVQLVHVGVDRGLALLQSYRIGVKRISVSCYLYEKEGEVKSNG